tara:strand:+ start:656 stop:1087 length:432 start_codon:yes stop_codon:yes gene_type:complete
MSKMKFGIIDDKYIQENIDDIVNLMTEVLPEKSSNSRNWRRNLKKEGSSENLSYIGFAILNKFKHIYNDYGKRVDAVYDREDLLDAREKREENALLKQIDINKNWRDITTAMREKLISETSREEYEYFLDESGLSKHSSYFSL